MLVLKRVKKQNEMTCQIKDVKNEFAGKKSSSDVPATTAQSGADQQARELLLKQRLPFPFQSHLDYAPHVSVPDITTAK